MKHIFILSFFLLVASPLIHAQVPGVGGKHFLIEYKPLLAYNFKFRLAHGFTLDYALARHFSISAHFEYFTKNDSTELAYIKSPSTHYKEAMFSYDKNIYTYGGEIRHYFSLPNTANTDLAPLGLYGGFVFNRNKIVFNVVPNSLADLGKYKYAYTTTGFSLGYRTLLLKNTTLDFGGNYLLMLINRYRHNSDPLINNKKELIDRINYGFRDRILTQCYISIGYMIF